MKDLTISGIRKLLAGGLLSVALALPAHSQEAVQTVEDESWRDKSERQLRRELRDAEETFFDAFNEVNSHKQYDIICKTTTPLGSRKRERKCQARFLWDYEEEMAENYARRSAGSPGPGAAASSDVQTKLDTLRAEMSSAMTEHADVAEAFAALNQAKRSYDLKLQEEN
jgi:glutamate synthase domain-containing protein 2